MRTFSPIVPVLALALVGLAACDKSKNQADEETKADAAKPMATKTDEAKVEDPEAAPVDDPAPAEAAAPAGDITLAMGDAKIFEKEDPSRGIIVATDGTLTLGDKVIGKVTSDGKVLDAEDKEQLVLGAEGAMTMSGEAIPMTLTETGMRIAKGDEDYVDVTFAEDGAVKFTPTEGAKPSEDQKMPPELMSEGCSGDMAQTCGFALTVYMFALSGATDEGPDSVPAAVDEADEVPSEVPAAE